MIISYITLLLLQYKICITSVILVLQHRKLLLAFTYTLIIMEREARWWGEWEEEEKNVITTDVYYCVYHYCQLQLTSRTPE